MADSAFPVRILVAGAGAFGMEHIKRLAARADVRLVGVADRNPAALDRVRSAYGGAALHAEALRMVEDVEADAVVVATPAASHIEIATRAIGRGLPVLLEKPVAVSAKDAVELAARQTRGAFVLPGHVLRFSRAHEKLVEILRSGKIGAPLYVNSRRYRDESHALNYADADAILTTLVHDIDLAQWIAGGEFRSAFARRAGEPSPRSFTAVSAVTAGGIICDLRTTWTFPGSNIPPDRLEVVGESGSVALVVGEGLRLYSGGKRSDLPLVEGDDALTNEHDHFLDCVRDRKLAPALGLPQAIAGLRLADAAMESLRLGREIAVTIQDVRM